MSDTVELVLTYHWYDMIASGKKRIEYRKNTAYWRKRIIGKKNARFRRGYNATCMEFKIKKIDEGPCPYEGWDDPDYLRIHF